MARTKVPNVQREDHDVPPTGQDVPRRFKMTARSRATPTVKGKSAVGVSPMDKRIRSPSETESEQDPNLSTMRKSRDPSKKQRAGKNSDPCAVPFADDDLDIGVNMDRYEKYFREKPFAPVVSVDFLAIRNDPELRIDLTEKLGRYECWLKINDEFSPEVVRKFYCNMSLTAKKDDDHIIRTQLRGKEIILTREILNQLLGAPMDFDEDLPEMSPEEAQGILRQNDAVQLAEKNFQPSIMCDYYRIIHYIFSRSMINKSFNFTNLTREECVLLARVIRGDKMDIGGWVFEIMKSFSSSKWQTRAYMPIPQLVSFILKKFSINHLHRDAKKRVDAFGRLQLKKMSIELPYDHRKGLLPQKDKGKKKKVVPEATDEPEEFQFPPEEEEFHTGTQAPSYADSSLKDFFMGEFEKMQDAWRSSIKTVVDNQTQLCKYQQQLLENQRIIRKDFIDYKSIQDQRWNEYTSIQDQRWNIMQSEMETMRKMMSDFSLGPSFSTKDLGVPFEQPGSSAHQFEPHPDFQPFEPQPFFDPPTNPNQSPPHS